MNLLLDTHTFIWSRAAPDRLARGARAGIADPDNKVLVSLVTAWELAIKLGLGKPMLLPPDVGSWFLGALQREQLELLRIELQHVAAVEHLPVHHRDPFDRLLIAQARSEGLTIVTRDRQFEPYDVPVIWT